MPAKCCLDKWKTLPQDEPVFTLLGRDLLAKETIKHWLKLAEEKGVNRGKIIRVHEHLAAIEEFQKENPERTKIPD